MLNFPKVQCTYEQQFEDLDSNMLCKIHFNPHDDPDIRYIKYQLFTVCKNTKYFLNNLDQSLNLLVDLSTSVAVIVLSYVCDSLCVIFKENC